MRRQAHTRAVAAGRHGRSGIASRIEIHASAPSGRCPPPHTPTAGHTPTTERRPRRRCRYAAPSGQESRRTSRPRTPCRGPDPSTHASLYRVDRPPVIFLVVPSPGPVVRSGMAYTPTGRLQVSSSDAAGSDGAGSPLIEAWPERTPMGLHNVGDGDRCRDRQRWQPKWSVYVSEPIYDVFCGIDVGKHPIMPLRWHLTASGSAALTCRRTRAESVAC